MSSTASNVANLISVAVALLEAGARVSSLVARAQAENREPTAEEIAAVVNDDDVARAKLVLAIEAAKAAGK